MEREKNRENGIRLSIMKREYITKVQKIKAIMDENETLLEKVAQAELDSEQKDTEITTLKNKKQEYRNKISILNEEKKSLQEILQNSEQTK